VQIKLRLLKHIWAEFAGRIPLHFSIDVLQNSRMKKLVNVMSFVFMPLWVLINWLDVNICKEPILVIVVNVHWIA